MARRGDSVIGIDLGKHVFKGVSLRRKSDSRLVLTSFASREVPEEFETSDALAWQREREGIALTLTRSMPCSMRGTLPYRLV